MSEIQGIARQKIHPGKLDEFKHLAAECMRSAREKDTGTLQYDFYFNTDESECIVYERYRDSAALLEHTQNLGDLMGKVMAIDHHRRSAWRAQPGAGPRTGELWGAGVSAMAEALIRGSSIQV
ncbi:MAG: antibiotic biosynthesis monooxygenase [Flavobacteriales bacterium]|nr:antibiotic biosynthesis monooxygenase [Flavobacteriales bacterium]